MKKMSAQLAFGPTLLMTSTAVQLLLIYSNDLKMLGSTPALPATGKVMES